MLNLADILLQLYPSKSKEEILGYVDKCNSVDYGDFDIYEWQKIKKEDLANEETQLKLINNLFESQTRYDGVDDEILRDLGEWSEGTVVFKDFDSVSVEFYQRFYCYLGWLNFARVGYERKLFLLETRFLLLACVWNIPIYHAVQRSFAYYYFVKTMKEDAKLFRISIERNVTLLGDEKGAYKQVGEWIKQFNEFVPKNLETAVDEFLKSSTEINSLSAASQDALGKIITLYWGLASGAIWKEIEWSEAGGMLEKKPNIETKQDDSYYIQAVEQVDDPEFIKMYLKDTQEIADWIDQSGKDVEFVKKLVRALAKKVNLKDQAEVSLLLKLMAALKEKGVENITDIIFYDEKTNQFTWDKELVS